MRLEVGLESFEVEDDPIFEQLVSEILGAYEFDSIPFKAGDVVLDIGAHQGIVSMYLARHYDVIVHAYEPVPENFAKLKRNLTRNKIATVFPHKLAVSADARYLEMVRGGHSAEASAWFTPNSQERFRARSTTLRQIFEHNDLDRVKLLKLDCEGAEHEILANIGELIDRIDYVRGEIHMIAPLRARGYTVEGTSSIIPAERAEWQVVEGA